MIPSIASSGKEFYKEINYDLIKSLCTMLWIKVWFIFVFFVWQFSAMHWSVTPEQETIAWVLNRLLTCVSMWSRLVHNNHDNYAHITTINYLFILCKLGYFLCIRCGLEYIIIFQSEGFDSEFEAQRCMYSICRAVIIRAGHLGTHKICIIEVLASCKKVWCHYCVCFFSSDC